METKTRFTYETVRCDEKKDVHLVLSLKAPKIDWEAKRSPVCVIPIVDISGSMSGAKIEYAKQTLLKLVDHLQPGDFCGLGAFSTEIYPIQPPVEMTSMKKEDIKGKIGDLKTRADTNFSGGIELGMKWGSEMDLPAGTLVRIIVLTDGLANKGVTSTAGLLEIVKTRGRSTLSCFGYGTDADQALLSDLARAGEGNYAFIRNPEEALTAFGKELGGLLSTYAQEIVLGLTPRGVHEIVEVVSDVDVEEDKPVPNDVRVVDLPKTIRVRLGDILSEEERHVVLKVRLTAENQVRDVDIVDVRLAYEVLEAGKRVKREEDLKATIRFVKAGEEQEKPTLDVDKIVALAELARVQIQAEEQAKAGNYGAAQMAFASAGLSFESRGLANVAAFSGNLGSRYGSSGAYGSSAGYRRSSAGAVRRASAVAQYDREALMDFGSSGLAENFSTENSAQASMAADFVEKPDEKSVKKKDVSKSKSKRW